MPGQRAPLDYDYLGTIAILCRRARLGRVLSARHVIEYLTTSNAQVRSSDTHQDFNRSAIPRVLPVCSASQVHCAAASVLFRVYCATSSMQQEIHNIFIHSEK